MGMSYRGSFRSLGSRVPVHFRSFADFRIVYRDYSVTHFRVPVCGQPFLGSRSLASPVHQCIEVPKALTAVVKVIECIFERPLITVELRGRHFEIVEARQGSHSASQESD